MSEGKTRLKHILVTMKEKPSSIIHCQAREQDRPKGSGPYLPQPTMGSRAQVRAYSQIHAHRIFTVRRLIRSPVEMTQSVYSRSIQGFDGLIAHTVFNSTVCSIQLNRDGPVIYYMTGQSCRTSSCAFMYETTSGSD